MGKGQFHSSLKSLDQWFKREKRVLPWRDKPTLYRVWISEIMLQQTQVVTVVPYFERFLKRFPTVKKLAQSSEGEVMKYWAGLGYYSRARNIHKTAKEIHRRGRFPRTKEDWIELPGVGPYTAGAIVSISLNQPEPILDGNIERVFSRLRRIPRNENWKRRLWRLSRIFVERAHGQKIEPQNLNQALMELGARVCTPKKPMCLFCPLKEMCRGFEFQDQLEFPPKKPRKKFVAVEEKVYWVENSKGHVLVEKRKPGQWRAGLWDLPEKLPPKTKLEPLGKIQTKHVVTNHKITRTTEVYLWRARSGQKQKWLDPNEFEALGSAFKKVFKSRQLMKR